MIPHVKSCNKLKKIDFNFFPFGVLFSIVMRTNILSSTSGSDPILILNAY